MLKILKPDWHFLNKRRHSFGRAAKLWSGKCSWYRGCCCLDMTMSSSINSRRCYLQWSSHTTHLLGRAVMVWDHQPARDNMAWWSSRRDGQQQRFWSPAEYNGAKWSSRRWSSIYTNINKTICWPSLGRGVQKWGLGKGGGRGKVRGGEESLGSCHSVLGLWLEELGTFALILSHRFEGIGAIWISSIYSYKHTYLHV